MPNSEDFTYVYQVTGGTAGGTMNVGTRFEATSNGHLTYTLTDGNDGALDGSTTFGDLLYYSDSSGTYQARLIALTEGGDPVIQFLSGGGTWIISNDPDLPQGGAVTTTDSGAYAYCFLHGTRIATASGHTTVEALRIGDTVLTADGRTVRVKWVGHQTVSTRFGPRDRHAPVRIRTGALGDGLPLHDLTLTADHALLIDGVLVNAGALVNGTTIAPVPPSEFGGSYTVYHVETEEHDIILAEGTPAETFIDYAGRRAFDNYAEYDALYGEERSIPEMTLPRITTSRQLPAALKSRLGILRVA